MSGKFTPMTPELYAYMLVHRSEHDPVLARLAQETAKLGGISVMQIAPEQGAFMALLARAIGARNAIEVGTFTGYSALCLARALPDGGRLIACDINEEWTLMARRYWQEAGVAHKIDLRLGPAIETLRALPRAPDFDLAFIDADKGGYREYYEEILPRLRAGGLILFDNVFYFGQVLDAASDFEDARALRALNDALASDARVESVMLPIADGLTIVRKRAASEGAGP